jgi:hypothetical protein
MKNVSWTMAAVVGILALACKGATDPRPSHDVGPVEPGRYQYLARSRSGQVLLVGRLDLTQVRDPVPPDSSSDAGGACCDWVIEGTWAIAWAPGADTTVEVGPQVGTGVLRGAYVPDGVVIEFNPYYADNNTGVYGPWTGNGLEGEWGWSTLTGPRAGGPATVKREP